MESGKIIVVANQKGGVAKTSTVRNLSYALAEMGKKVLVVDFDPQYNLTTSFGVLPTQAPYNTGTLITNLLLDESLPDTNEFIQKIDSVDLIPSSRYLTVAEANLLMTPDSNGYLATLLAPLRMSYDYIIVDTNPSLGSLTINALTAADEVIIPIDPELFALTGLQALMDTIKKIKQKLNPRIDIGGILFTKCNKRTNLYRRTYGQVAKAFQSLPIFNCQIPYTVKVGDANSYCMARCPGRVFSREQLYNAAWGEDYELGTNTVDNTIWRLRGKLESDPKHPIYIKTVFRVGYKIER